MTANIDQFVARWQTSGAAERANHQLFLSELCDAFGAPRPDPTTPDDAANAYVFEKPVPLPPGATWGRWADVWPGEHQGGPVDRSPNF